MASVVKDDDAFNTAGVGLPGSEAVMFEADGAAGLIKEFGHGAILVVEVALGYEVRDDKA